MTTLLAEAYFHTIDPFAIQFTESFGVRWYGLAYMAGFLIAWLLYLWFARTGRSTLEPKYVPDLMFYGIVGVLLGGRLGYVFFYDPSLLTEFSTDLPFWSVLAIHRGGMASHGGMIGVLVALLLFARRQGISPLHLLDIAALAAPPGLFLGRCANFISGELIGRPVADQQNPPWWSMKFPQEMRQWSAEQLAQVRGIVDYTGLTPREWDNAIEQIITQQRPPQASFDLVNGTVERLIELTQSGNETVIEHLRPLLTAVYPSQLVQATTDGPILFAVIALVWLRPRRPGVIGGTFLIAYGILRIISEFFREPDAALWFGLTRGQSLSTLMVIAGIALVWWASQRSAQPLGGLLTRPERAAPSPNQ